MKSSFLGKTGVNNGTHFTEYGQVFAVSYIVMINRKKRMEINKNKKKETPFDVAIKDMGKYAKKRINNNYTYVKGLVTTDKYYDEDDNYETESNILEAFGY